MRRRPGLGFKLPQDLAVRLDGVSVYAAARTSDSVSHFFAAPQGQLTFGGCVAQTGADGCTDIPGSAFDGTISIAVSPDGQSLYALNIGSSSLSQFSIAPQGQVTFVRCFSDDGSGGACTDVPGAAFANPQDVVVSPDGDSVYVTSTTSGSVSHFFREPSRDTDPPGVTVTARKVKAGKPIKASVSCDEACTVKLSGLAKPKGGKQRALPDATVQLTPGQGQSVALKPKRKLKKSLKQAGTGKATLLATATDAAGNSADATARVKLK